MHKKKKKEKNKRSFIIPPNCDFIWRLVCPVFIQVVRYSELTLVRFLGGSSWLSHEFLWDNFHPSRGNIPYKMKIFNIIYYYLWIINFYDGNLKIIKEKKKKNFLLKINIYVEYIFIKLELNILKLKIYLIKV